jgi:hypothetical protein
MKVASTAICFALATAESDETSSKERLEVIPVIIRRKKRLQAAEPA